jgi:hypothetical protein
VQVVEKEVQLEVGVVKVVVGEEGLRGEVVEVEAEVEVEGAGVSNRISVARWVLLLRSDLVSSSVFRDVLCV